MDLIFIAFIAATPGLLAGLASMWFSYKKNPHDIAKTDAETKKAHAETESIHAQVADRWAEHVSELQDQVNELEKQRVADRTEMRGLSFDISQVRRENEQYRLELSERDAIIADLQDWAGRLVNQLAVHAPGIKSEDFYRKGSR
jgi:peptidoglycan hydrolase CwlO-like protein